MYLGVAENLAKLLITLCTASRKSFSVTTFLRALMANMPASVHTLRSSAPVELGHNLASSSYLMSFSTLMDLAWILKMFVLPSWSHESRVKCVWSVGCHQHLDVATRVETIQLVNQLQHGSLNLVVTTSAVIKPGATNCVNLVEEDETGLLRPCHLKEFSHHSRALSNILLNQF